MQRANPQIIRTLSDEQFRQLPDLAASGAGDAVRLMVELWPGRSLFPAATIVSAFNHAVLRGVDAALTRFLLEHRRKLDRGARLRGQCRRYPRLCFAQSAASGWRLAGMRRNPSRTRAPRWLKPDHLYENNAALYATRAIFLNNLMNGMQLAITRASRATRRPNDNQEESHEIQITRSRAFGGRLAALRAPAFLSVSASEAAT